MKGRGKYVLVYKNSGQVLCKRFQATRLSTYDFSNLYTTLPHNQIIKKKFLIWLSGPFI